MTAQIANTLDEVLQPKGVAVVIEAAHQCMTTRGVHKPGVSHGDEPHARRVPHRPDDPARGAVDDRHPGRRQRRIRLTSRVDGRSQHTIVTPAKAGSRAIGRALALWIPAFAGMTSFMAGSGSARAGGRNPRSAGRVRHDLGALEPRADRLGRRLSRPVRHRLDAQQRRLTARPICSPRSARPTAAGSSCRAIPMSCRWPARNGTATRSG